MKVYVAGYYSMDEGYDIISIHSTQELAEAACKNSRMVEIVGLHMFDVLTYELDGPEV